MQSEKANEVQFLSKTVSWDVDHQFLKTGARHGEWVKNLSLHFSSLLFTEYALVVEWYTRLT